MPCWVTEMSDAEGYMTLVLSDAQSELTPIECAFHGPRSPLDGKACAAAGWAKSTVATEIQGAPVAADVHREIDFLALANGVLRGVSVVGERRL